MKRLSCLLGFLLAACAHGWSCRTTPTLKNNTYIRLWTGGTDLRICHEVFTR